MKTLAQLLGVLHRLGIRADEILLGDSLYHALVSQAREIARRREEEETYDPENDDE
ncbi:MAG: hypothetical protein AAC990_02135 [Dehalococcoides mccartyi]|uniref:hypothetical protein n=1 Tax=Dehalococcoides mccartyi TaxID=61435 RepID=UPI0030F4E20A